MRKLVMSAIVASCATATAHAQTYLGHLQQSKAGKGKVVVTQSKEIDEVVNGPRVAVPADKMPQDVIKSREDSARSKAHGSLKDTVSERETQKTEEGHKVAEDRRSAENRGNEGKNKIDKDGEMNIPTVDMRRKVMRGSRKVTGYRVQAFAGGNTRNDKQRAQQIGNAIKMKFPDQPVYVHFYSPRWICRIGNFRNYQEAQRLLKQVKAMGYRAATIVTGKITVQD